MITDFVITIRGKKKTKNYLVKEAASAHDAVVIAHEMTLEDQNEGFDTKVALYDPKRHTEFKGAKLTAMTNGS